MLVGKIVGEVGVSPELLAGRVAAAASHLADAAESAILRVHPDAGGSADLTARVNAARDTLLARRSLF